MRLRQLQIQHMGPYQEEAFFFERTGLHVLQAPNERGKSTLLAALRGVLFGQARLTDSQAIVRPGATVVMMAESEQGIGYQVERNVDKKQPPLIHGPDGAQMRGQEALSAVFPEFRQIEQVLYDTFFTFQLADLTAFSQKSAELASQLFGIRAPLVNPYQLERALDKESKTLYNASRRAKKPVINALSREWDEVRQGLTSGRHQARWFREAQNTHREIESEIASLQVSVKLRQASMDEIKRQQAAIVLVSRFLDVEAQLRALGDCPSGSLEDWREAFDLSAKKNEEVRALEMDRADWQALTGQLADSEQWQSWLPLRPELIHWRERLFQMKDEIARYDQLQREMAREEQRIREVSRVSSPELLEKFTQLLHTDARFHSLQQASQAFWSSREALEDVTQQQKFAHAWTETKRAEVQKFDSMIPQDFEVAMQVARQRETQLSIRQDEIRAELRRVEMATPPSDHPGERRRFGLGRQVGFFALGLLLLLTGLDNFIGHRLLTGGLLLLGALVLLVQAALSVKRPSRRVARGTDLHASDPTTLSAELRDIQDQLNHLEQLKAHLGNWQHAREQAQMQDVAYQTKLAAYQLYESQYSALLADLGLPCRLLSPAELAEVMRDAKVLCEAKDRQQKLALEAVAYEKKFETSWHELMTFLECHSTTLKDGDAVSVQMAEPDFRSVLFLTKRQSQLETSFVRWCNQAEEASEIEVERTKSLLKRARVEDLIHRREETIQQLDASIQNRFEALWASDWAAYRDRVAVEERRQNLHHEYEQVRMDLIVAAGGERGASKLVHLLKQIAPEELAQRLTDLQTEQAEEEARLQERQERFWQLKQQMTQSQTSSAVEELQWKEADLQRRIQDAKETYASLVLARALSEKARKAVEMHHSSPVLKAAEGFLMQITSGRYCGLSVPLNAEGLNAIQVRDKTERLWPLEVLSRGTREQVYLALRFAVIQSYRAQNVILPVVLDDPLVNFDDIRAGQVIEVLRALGESQPIIYLTCHSRYTSDLEGLPDVHVMESAQKLEESI